MSSAISFLSVVWSLGTCNGWTISDGSAFQAEHDTAAFYFNTGSVPSCINATATFVCNRLVAAKSQTSKYIEFKFEAYQYSGSWSYVNKQLFGTIISDGDGTCNATACVWEDVTLLENYLLSYGLGFNRLDNYLYAYYASQANWLRTNFSGTLTISCQNSTGPTDRPTVMPTYPTYPPMGSGGWGYSPSPWPSPSPTDDPALVVGLEPSAETTRSVSTTQYTDLPSSSSGYTSSEIGTTDSSSGSMDESTSTTESNIASTSTSTNEGDVSTSTTTQEIQTSITETQSVSQEGSSTSTAGTAGTTDTDTTDGSRATTTTNVPNLRSSIAIATTGEGGDSDGEEQEDNSGSGLGNLMSGYALLLIIICALLFVIIILLLYVIKSKSKSKKGKGNVTLGEKGLDDIPGSQDIDNDSDSGKHKKIPAMIQVNSIASSIDLGSSIDMNVNDGIINGFEDDHEAEAEGAGQGTGITGLSKMGADLIEDYNNDNNNEENHNVLSINSDGVAQVEGENINGAGSGGDIDAAMPAAFATNAVFAATNDSGIANEYQNPKVKDYVHEAGFDQNGIFDAKQYQDELVQETPGGMHASIEPVNKMGVVSDVLAMEDAVMDDIIQHMDTKR